MGVVVGHKHAMEVCEEHSCLTRCRALRSGRTGIAVSCPTEAFEWEELQRRSEPRDGVLDDDFSLELLKETPPWCQAHNGERSVNFAGP